MKLFCYELTDNTSNACIRYGLVSTRGAGFGAGKRYVRSRNLHNWTLTVYEVDAQ